MEIEDVGVVGGGFGFAPVGAEDALLTLDTMVEQDEAVRDAVEALLTFAVTLKTNERSRRIELECRMCGQRDENHTPTCPVPALEEWLNPAR